MKELLYLPSSLPHHWGDMGFHMSCLICMIITPILEHTPFFRNKHFKLQLENYFGLHAIFQVLFTMPERLNICKNQGVNRNLLQFLCALKLCGKVFIVKGCRDGLWSETVSTALKGTQLGVSGQSRVLSDAAYASGKADLREKHSNSIQGRKVRNVRQTALQTSKSIQKEGSQHCRCQRSSLQPIEKLMVEQSICLQHMKNRMVCGRGQTEAAACEEPIQEQIVGKNHSPCRGAHTGPGFLAATTTLCESHAHIVYSRRITLCHRNRLMQKQFLSSSSCSPRWKLMGSWLPQT